MKIVDAVITNEDTARRIDARFGEAAPQHAMWWRRSEAIIYPIIAAVGVLPSDVIHANRIAKMRDLDALLSGILITRAAISDVSADEFKEFMERHVETLMLLIGEHSVSVKERIAKARGRYRLD